MNIFFTDRSPIEAARNLDDLRLNKMILESCQLMSTVMHKHGRQGPYRPTHANHPCTLWLCQSQQHYDWVKIHTHAMLDMWGAPHMCAYVLDQLKWYKFDDNGWSDPPNCTNFKHIDNIVTAYRTAMIHKWSEDIRPPRWTRGNRKPTWIGQYHE